MISIVYFAKRKKAMDILFTGVDFLVKLCYNMLDRGGDGMIYNFDELTFQILTIDPYTHEKGVFNVKARPYAAFSLRLSGTGSFEVAGKRFVTSPGDVLFIPADTPYKVEYSVSESIVVHFRSCNYYEAENIDTENSAAIALLFRQLLQGWSEEHSVNQAKATIYEILEKIEKDKKRSAEDTAFTRCVEYIDEHFCEPELDIGTVCHIGFISASSLQRAFQTHFGLSPKQYLLKLRMNRAIELLTENALTVKEVSFSCGFSDEKYFSRVFKKRYGYPPSEMRDHIFI